MPTKNTPAVPYAARTALAYAAMHTAGAPHQDDAIDAAGYCLDAPEILPAGSMARVGPPHLPRLAVPIITYVYR